jgi:hypothetical protein
MEPNVGNIFSENEFVVGIPAKVGEVVGRITGLEGDSYHGEFPIVILTTPHGSTVRSGRCFVKLELDEEEIERLAYCERQVPCCMPLYGGKLTAIGG